MKSMIEQFQERWSLIFRDYHRRSLTEEDLFAVYSTGWKDGQRSLLSEEGNDARRNNSPDQQ